VRSRIAPAPKFGLSILAFVVVVEVTVPLGPGFVF